MTVGALAPGSVIGILGGGQLGRMTAIAAAELGYRAHIYCQAGDDPAAQVATATVAGYDDQTALTGFARACDAVTLEFENIPLVAVKTVAAVAPMRPGAKALGIAQDRLAEKDFVAGLGIATAAYRALAGPQDLKAARADLGPIIAKKRRLGYDGKGQVRIDDADIPAEAWAALGARPAIAEAVVDFAVEISVIAARGLDGATATYVPVENRHVDGILATTIAPAAIDLLTADAAREIALRLIEALDIVGLLAVEMFVTTTGDLLVNEIAPRPHNSGHWTLDACAVSQFEQLVRAVAGLPLGDPARHSDAEMHNLIGDTVDRWPELAADSRARLHLYGKTETRPGRKMGHVTYLRPRTGAGP
ncbi:MAG: 5-(carboxyamino)imidazole ribonucleotide synthase [Alphaproteobacteria bacterium]|nr:5-(carboxyamino)imidazole ribonucleotide synthase [Alphaproteobacteria bacterium]